ncbi:MAG: hypothetical protein KBI01_04395 [Oscillospiraceae bacterium]|nr:hypothetical protein [Oscillospiraceae bacterium]
MLRRISAKYASLPKEIKNAPPCLTIRVEVYISRDTFSELNAEREITGEKLFAKPRNSPS